MPQKTGRLQRKRGKGLSFLGVRAFEGIEEKRKGKQTLNKRHTRLFHKLLVGELRVYSFCLFLCVWFSLGGLQGNQKEHVNLLNLPVMENPGRPFS